MPRAFTIAILAVVLSMVAVAATGYYYRQSPGPLAQPETVIIPRGIGFYRTVMALTEHGVIDFPPVFAMLAIVEGKARKFRAGEYLFPAESSPATVMDMLVRGVVVPHKLTVPEGFTVRDVTALLANEPLLSGEIEGPIEEGSLLPETYYFVYGDTRQEMLARMQLGQATALAELWPKRSRDLPFETPQQAVTLASIVEKETRIEEERGLIAAVFVNRLKRGMPLQADPTVIYAIEREQGPLGRELTTADLAVASPYNTYKIIGLPPGPICNPGYASLAAVLNPPDTGDYYFVADGEGGHRFSSTLEKHNGNVRQYRKRIRQSQ